VLIIMRRHLLLAVLGTAFLLTVGGGAGAQSYPDRPVRLVVPFPAGSTTDLVGRILGHKLAEKLGQQVVIENRGGAGGVVGTEMVARTAPDGYTVLLGTIGTHSINPSLYKSIPYDPVADFEPVIQFGSAPNVLVVHPSVTAKTLPELVAYAKARPGQVNYGSSGNGTSNHLSGAYLVSRAGLDAVHVPYRGGAQAIQDLLRGDLSMMFYHYLPLLPHIQEGVLRPIAITSAERIPALPDVPTMGESGMTDFVVSAWFGVYVPAKTPAEIVKRLHADITAIITAPEVKESLIAQGIDPISGSPEDLAALMQSELKRWAKVIEASGAKVD
jgi:tripartite-type tricarboxylate transporter receptor subunit TctC